MNAEDELQRYGIQIPHQRINSAGTEIIGQCPFHHSDSDSDHTFNMSIETGLWHCWSCEAKGNIYQFISRYTNLTPDQIRIEGDALPEHKYKLKKPISDRHKHLSEVELDVLTGYVSGLHEYISTGKARQWITYLNHRKISTVAVNHFQLGAGGYIRNYNRDYMQERNNAHTGRNVESILRGLRLYNRKDGDYWWSRCIVIPYILEDQVYFCNARLLPGYDTRIKYQGMSGIQRDIFFNDDALEEHDQVYVVEGEFNAMAMWSVGIKNVVSFGGKQQFNSKLIDRLYGVDVTLYFDTDKDDPEFHSRGAAIEKLMSIARSVSYFELPQGIDINDYLINHSGHEFEDEILAKVVSVPDADEFLPGEYRILTESEQTPVISLAEAQQINEKFVMGMTRNFKSFSGARVLNNMPVGTGKTHSVINLVNSKKNTKALVLTSTHYLCTEYDDQLDFDTFTCHLKGRGHPDIGCKYSAQANSMTSRGYSLKFKLNYCMNKCALASECEHIKLQEYAKYAQVLIATHAHGQLKDFFISPYYANNRRRLIIIDEQADLIKEVNFSRKDIAFHLYLLKNLSFSKVETRTHAQALIDALGMMELSRISRRGCHIPQVEIGRGSVYEIDLAIAGKVTDDETQPCKLYDLANILSNGIPLQYDHDNDALFYTWRPIFPKRACVIFMSGTTPKAYLELALGISITHIVGDQFQVRRDNLQVIQLLNVSGGRQRLLIDKERQKSVQAVFDAILTKHQDQRIMIATSLGAGLVFSDLLSTAKEKVIEMLNSIASNHNRRLVAVSTSDLECGNVPDSIRDIPVIHYGIRGTNIFGEYDVLVELTAHYYNERSITESVKRIFSIDISNTETIRLPGIFRTVDKEYTIEKRIHPDQRVRLFVESTQEADIVQAEGRILRGQDTDKTIYRLHNVNVKPFPDRVYKTWSQLLKSEFGKLSDMSDQVLKWIKDHKAVDQEFTTAEIVQGVGVHRENLSTRHLRRLSRQGYIQVVKPGQRGRGKNTIWKRSN